MPANPHLDTVDRVKICGITRQLISRKYRISPDQLDATTQWIENRELAIAVTNPEKSLNCHFLYSPQTKLLRAWSPNQLTDTKI